MIKSRSPILDKGVLGLITRFLRGNIEISSHSVQWDVPFSLKTNQSLMSKMNRGIFSLLGTRTTTKRRIIIGLKSDNSSREMLLRLLNSFVLAGDYVLAVHVRGVDDDTFDPNTFYIHEDLCKSKMVDFEVKVCLGSCYITELTNQVRINFATTLALGCSSKWYRPKDSTIAKCLKALPPTCTLLLMDNGGKILFRKEGCSQEGSSVNVLQSSNEGSSTKVLLSSVSSLSASNGCDQSGAKPLFRKSSSMPCSSKTQKNESINRPIVKKNLQLYEVVTPELFKRLATLEVKGYTRRYTFYELRHGTQDFSPDMLIGEGGHSQVYRAVLNNGQAVAVKVLKSSRFSEDDLFREVEISSSLSHENIVQLLGYCYSKEIRAIVYNLLSSSLKQRLKQLSWRERMQLAVGVARALEYLHSFCPPIIHRDVKSSNILLSHDCKPQLSDFGASIVHQQTSSAFTKPINVVGTFGYLAPEYMMYGKVDEKIDVYSYGVVLLELITGKEAIQTNSPSNRESLVLWARSLLTCGLCERLIDPDLKEDYDKDEMKTMMMAARLCLLHSSSRRPTMKTILHLFEEPENWLKKHKKREELVSTLGKGEMALTTVDDSDPNDFWVIDDK